MPIVEISTYRAPWLFTNPHVQTIVPSVFRRVKGVSYRRERISTPDDDFIDLDWSRAGAKKAVVVLHGLEGNSDRAYVLGMVRAVNRGGWDAVAMNFRGCSGECNRQLRFYHSGDTADLDTVISHVIGTGIYEEIAILGFSLGGNVVLKYVGERGNDVPPQVRKAVAFSVPVDLTAGSREMGQPSNRIYMKRFLKMLHEKIQMKMELMPGKLNDDGYHAMQSFKDFDDRYTAPIHGFRDAEDYWEQSSSKPFLNSVSIPTLLVNAADDPFLPEECYPVDKARSNPHFHLEIPAHGGHAGFIAFNAQKEYWSEYRAVQFLDER